MAAVRNASLRGWRPSSRVVRVAAGVGAAAAGSVAVAGGVVLGREVRRSGPRVLVERARRSRRVAHLALRRSFALARLRARRAGDEELDAFHVHTAEQVFELMGGLKGAIMKLGQMLSIVAENLPEVYQQALRGLQQSAPPMAAHLVADVVKAELGQPPERAFFEFSPEPVAAASIGQVHRARLFDGTPVAVKVQYPGVDVAIRADLDNAFLLYSAARALAPGIDPEPVVSELRERMGDELDYRIEAANQEEFRAAYDGHPWVRIPAVHREVSTARVLVSEWVSGRSFYELLDEPQERRDRVGEQLFRFWAGSVSRMLLFNADPHPGNYFFEDDGPGDRGVPEGKIWFLDFGLVKRFQTEEIENLKDRVLALRSGDDGAVIAAIQRHGWLRPGTKIDYQRMVQLARLSVLPLVDHRPFTYTREYISETIDAMFNIEGPYGDVIRQMTLPRNQLMLTRIHLGLGGLFTKLGATADWASILDEYLFDAPPSTLMGEEAAGWPKVPLGANRPSDNGRSGATP
ncbi:MAG TPA: AarF/ABC1/UbiB kinase family protein [Acidimicrobiia bacterium]|nr:AarF/ABC1/UbiB kinase family protein [Acidimicrobiia bacterium]